MKKASKKVESLVALLVEDEPPLQEIIKKKLELNGFSVVSARTAKQALDYLEELDQVDFIWLDHYLIGKETGLDFVVKLKDPKSKWRKVPIFVVSNTASPDKIDAYIRLGVEKYYTKSNYRLDEMIIEVKKFLKK